MEQYTILTDSGCDIDRGLLAAWNVPCAPLSCRAADGASLPQNVSPADFYRMMRDGAAFQTAAVNVEAFRELFERDAKAGKDVLYIGLSSGLSRTVQSAAIAAEEVRNEYPERTILVADSLCASAGQGFLVYGAVRMREDGAPLTETAAWVNGHRLRVCHWFTVDDLTYLKRGGRIGSAAAFAATALDLKPVMHMDDEGCLTNRKKVRGRRQAIREIAAQFRAAAEGTTYFISHGDCPEDAAALEEILLGEIGEKSALITDIGPVIGSHSGPGTLALFFMGKHR